MYPTVQTDDKEEREAVIRQSTASCLRLLSSILMVFTFILFDSISTKRQPIITTIKSLDALHC